MRIKNLFLALLALPLFFVACDKGNDTVDTPKDATVTITAGSFTESEISFTIASTNAEKVAYIVIEAAEEAPMASEVLANGVVIDANKSVDCTKGELKAETTYTIIAVAQNSKGVDKKSIEMTTLQGTVTPDPGPDPGPDTKVEFVATNLYAEYSDEEGHIYGIMLGDKEFGDKGWGVDGGTYFTIYILASSKGNGVLPNGRYALGEEGGYTANTILYDYSYRHQMANGTMVNSMEIFKEGYITISDGKIEGEFVLDRDDSVHHVVYEGDLSVDDGGSQAPVEFEATHTADKWLWGGSSNYGNKYQVVGEGFSVDVHFPAQEATETTLTPQLYTWVTTTMFGTTDVTAEVPYHFTTRTFTVNGTSVAVDAGAALVEAEGEEYHIEMTLQGRDGFVYMIEYNGKINDKGEVGGDENATIVFTNFEYSTYMSSYGFHEYKLTNEAGDSLILDVNDFSANENTINPGSYTWYTRSMCGTQGLFSTNTIKVAGISYKAAAGTLVVAEKETLDLTITLTMESGDEMTFTYAAPENGGNEGGNEGGSTEPAEPVKLATPSVFGNVEGNTVVISWQEIEGAKDYTVTLEGVETKTVTNTYITYSNLAWDTTYNVSVVANSSNEALYITSDAGTTSFSTGAQPGDGGDEGGNEGPIASYENWVFDAELNMGAKQVTCTDGTHTVVFTLNAVGGGTFYIFDSGVCNITNVYVNGVETTDASGTMIMSSNNNYYITLDAYINGVHYTGTSKNPVV